MAKRKEIVARSYVIFRENMDERIPMEEVNANPELRKKFDERLKAVLEDTIPKVPGFMEALIKDSEPELTT